MPEPKKESYTACEECSKAEGEPVVYHRSQLELVESFWGGESDWQCPNGHKVNPPAPKPAT